MKTRYFLVTGAVLMASGIVLAWGFFSLPKARVSQLQVPETREDLAPVIASLTQSVMALQKKMETLSEKVDRKMSRVEQQQDAVLKTQEVHEDSEEISDEQTRQQAEQWYERQIEKLDAVLVSEPKDDDWSVRTTGRLEETFEKLNDYEIKEISCSGTLCKVNARISPQDLQREGGIDGLVHGTMGWEGQTIASVDEETGEVTVYLLREGVDLLSESNAGEVE